MTSPSPLTVESERNFATLPVSVTGVPSQSIEKTEEERERERVQGVLTLARERFRDAANAENKRREEMLTDLKFRCGQQWDESIELQRRNQGRPCLVINRIPGFVKQVQNQLRQSRP